jgi:hypothetical protein
VEQIKYGGWHGWFLGLWHLTLTMLVISFIEVVIRVPVALIYGLNSGPEMWVKDYSDYAMTLSAGWWMRIVWVDGCRLSALERRDGAGEKLPPAE